MLLLPYFGVKYFIDKDNIKEDVGNAVVRGPSRLLLVLRCTAALSRDSESLQPAVTQSRSNQTRLLSVYGWRKLQARVTKELPGLGK